MSDRKVFLLGLDGVPPHFFHRFVAEGRMPRFARLLQRAAVFDVVPTFPPLTAPGWMSIASGAQPSTIGVENILVNAPDDRIDAIRNGFDQTLSHAEYLWETLERNEMDSVVLQYPGTWPPRGGGFVQVDGAGGYADIACRFAASPSCAFVCGAAPAEEAVQRLIFPADYAEHWRIHADANGLRHVIAREPSGWSGLSPGAQPVFEVVLHLREHGRRAERTLFALCCRNGAETFLVVSPDRDGGGREAFTLRRGCWSGWRVHGEGGERFALRFKLIALDADARRLHLYQSEGHRLSGFTRPDDIADELVRNVGPVVEWAGTYDFFNGLVDLETQLEIYEQHTDWLAGAIRHLARRRPWHGFFTHWHVIEYAHHLVGAGIHPDHPLHRPENAERDLEFLGRTYALADRLLEAVEDVSDGDMLLLVASDHGHDLIHSVFYANEFLRRHGWLTTTNAADGAPALDQSSTSAFALFPGYVHLNVESRPSGTLSTAAARVLAERIASELRALVDPRTGAHPIKIVLMRDELAAFGLYGPGAPDLAFSMERGYEVATRIRDDRALPEFELTGPYETATSGHGSFFPASPSARTLAVFAGPGFEPGAEDRRPVPIVDLAPTVTEFLGIPAPRDCDGRPIPRQRTSVPA
jgi:predicted AlkP superfamily phosphohydrolase/phosphomutase